VKHQAPMGSLNKAQHDPTLGQSDELGTWFKSCLGYLGGDPFKRMIVSDKCDGISIALYYTDGKLTQAVTRGDGEVGEDITRNVVKMKGVVPTIPKFDGFIRGEIVLRKSDWQKHFPTYANPRNAASGIAKRLDGTGSEHLTVLHYQMIRFTGKAIPSKEVEFKVLEKLGAALPSYYMVQGLKAVRDIYARYVDTARDALDYDIDGLVIEFDNPAEMEALGMKNHRPKGAVAYKFPHDKKLSVLRAVQWQVGNTGRITPVAIFDPVKLAGATVTQASLHNARRVEGLKLFPGCSIVVSRRNDVIPMVEENIDEGISIKDL
jgi:DNA ligase (NAD+)